MDAVPSAGPCSADTLHSPSRIIRGYNVTPSAFADKKIGPAEIVSAGPNQFCRL